MNKFPAALLSLWCLTSMAVSAQEAPTGTSHGTEVRSVNLERFFGDDFRRNSLTRYVVGGDVEWNPGSVRLDNGSSLSREVDGGAWARLEIDLEVPEDSKDKTGDAFSVTFELDGGGTFAVSAIRELSNGHSLTRFSLHHGKTDEDIRVLAQATVPALSGKNSIALQCRYGLLTLELNGESIRHGFAKTAGAKINQFTIKSAEPCQLRRVDVLVLPEPPATSEQQKATMEAAHRFNEQSKQFQEGGKFDEALNAAEQALIQFRMALPISNPDHAANIEGIAQWNRTRNKDERALRLFADAAAIRRIVVGSDHPDYALCLYRQSECLDSLGRMREAVPFRREAVGIFKSSLGKHARLSLVTSANLAHLADKAGLSAEATEIHLSVLESLDHVYGRKSKEYASALNNLGMHLNLTGDYAEAVRILEDCIQHKDASGSDNWLTLLNLADAYRCLGDMARSEQAGLRALEFVERAHGKDSPEFAHASNNLGLLCAQNNKLAAAEKHYANAIAIWETGRPGTQAALSTASNNLAAIKERMGEYDLAIKMYERVKASRSETSGETHPDYADSLNNLGMLLLKVGKSDKAHEYLERSLSIHRNVTGENHPAYAVALKNLALVDGALGNSSSALALHEQAFQILYDHARNVLPAVSESQANRLFGTRYYADLGPVFSFWGDVHSEFSSSAYEYVWESKGRVSRLRVGRHLPDDATPDARIAADQLLDERTRISKLAAASPPPQMADSFQKQLSEAIQRKEELETRLARLNPGTTREIAIRDASVSDLLGMLPADVAVIDFVKRNEWVFTDEEYEASSGMGNSERRIVKTDIATPVIDAFILRSGVSKSQRIVGVHLGAAEPIDVAVEKWRSQLGSQSASLSERRLGSVSAQARQADVIEDPNDGRLILRRLVWDKLEPHLQGVHTVVVLPDGELHRLPWAALPGREPGTFLIEDYALSTASYGQQLLGLLRDLPVAGDGLLVAAGIDYDRRESDDYETGGDSGKLSNRNLRRKTQGHVNRKNITADPLPESFPEAEAILSSWGDRGEGQLLSEAGVTEDRLLSAMPNARYIHLATHGFFEKSRSVYTTDLRRQSLYESSVLKDPGGTVAVRNPLLMSGIVVSGFNLSPPVDNAGLPIGEDGVVTAEDLVGLDLSQTEMVTLSACETALGDVAGGEGVFGLQRALHQAGVRSVVASLWKVDDDATRALMIEFYTNLWDKKLSKLDALREAQLTMLRGYDPKSGQLTRSLGGKSIKVDTTKPAAEKTSNSRLDPRYWAAFQLSGDWR